ncbi:MAG: nickel pincer cofactor biosynthesis protein LarC [Acidobacteria bacterium]|nr:nickel pincer cofactor biosynthesis protein LarC [Acidobacteriota bacterium]
MAKRVAYLDCFSGISGDMFLGALVDAGVSVAMLEQTVAALNVGARLEASKVVRGAISATKIDVWVGNEKDMPREQYWAQRSHGDHGRAHDHSGDPLKPAIGMSGGSHVHRGLKEIREIIGRASLDARAKQTAISIFEALGAAEAKIHGIDVNDVHFHEVGAVDAIVDIVCASVGIHSLDVDEWVCSPVNVGGGTVQCAHGSFPVPSPAATELLKNAPVFSSGVDAELATPTGAAILKVIVKRFAALPAIRIQTCGYGAGTRDFPNQANVLRLLMGEAIDQHVAAHAPTHPQESSSRAEGATCSFSEESITVLEANIDDLNPQVIGYVVDRALEAGALDVFSTAVQMKKNRPGVLLTVLCRPEDAAALSKLLFAETTTLGIRTRRESRQVLTRRSVPVSTPWGEVRMKVANLNGTVANYAPEYEDCRRIATERQIPLKQVMQEVMRIYLESAKTGNSAEHDGR